MEQDPELDSLVAQQLINEVNQFLTSYEQYENTHDIGRIHKIQSEMDKYEEQRERFFDEYQSIMNDMSDIERRTNKNDSKGLGGMLQGKLKTGPTMDELKLKQEEYAERLAKIDIDIRNLQAKKNEFQDDIREKLYYNREHIQRLINTTGLIMFLITTPPPPQEESTKCCSCVRRGGKTKRVRRLQSKSKNKSRR
jgi:hypothetical protein